MEQQRQIIALEVFSGGGTEIFLFLNFCLQKQQDMAERGGGWQGARQFSATLVYLSKLLTSSYFYNKLGLPGLQSFRMQEARNIFIATISCLRSNTKVADLLRHFKNQLRMIKMRQARLDPQAVLKKYQILSGKYQRGTLLPRPRGWHENERRLFLWFLLAYYHLNYKKYSEITSREWREFSECFAGKDVLLLRYEAVALEKSSQRVFWAPAEEALLRDLFKGSVNGKWGDISRGLFFRSEGQYYKTSKQCREHWFNHLNTDIRKGQWTIEEDITILTFVLNEGRHWSRLIEQIGRVRTEHMAKNRFGSLLTFGRKYCNTVSEVNQNDENILISSIIDYLSTHKGLLYDNNSPSSPEALCKSDKSISIECPEFKQEVLQIEDNVEKMPTNNRLTQQSIRDIADNNQVVSLDAANLENYNTKQQITANISDKSKVVNQQPTNSIHYGEDLQHYLPNQHFQPQERNLQGQQTIPQHQIIPQPQVMAQPQMLYSGGALLTNESPIVSSLNQSIIYTVSNPFSYTFNAIQLHPPNVQVMQPFAIINYVLPYIPQQQEPQEEGQQ